MLAETENLNSEQLARAAQGGDRHALDLLIRRHKSDVYRVALRMCGRPADAEEILQLTLERLVRHLGRFDATRTFRPWLLSIAANQARTWLRKQAIKSLFFLDKPDSVETQGGPGKAAHSLESAELKEHLSQALLTLPVDQREAFIFKHIEGLSFAEMASAMGASEGALRVRVHRARQALLSYLRDRHVTFSQLHG